MQTEVNLNITALDTVADQRMIQKLLLLVFLLGEINQGLSSGK